MRPEVAAPCFETLTNVFIGTVLLVDSGHRPNRAFRRPRKDRLRCLGTQQEWNHQVQGVLMCFDSEISVCAATAGVVVVSLYAGTVPED